MSKDLLILSGGFGTRLSSYIKGIPKALAPISDLTFLDLQIENWKKEGINSFIFLLHYRSEEFIKFIGSSLLLKDCKYEFLVEDYPLGTGGAIANAVKILRLRDDFLVINSDTWIEGGISLIQKCESPALLIKKVNDTSRYGEVIMDSTGKIKSFLEKTNNANPGFINAGLFHFHPDLFIDWDGSPFSLETKLLPALARENLLNGIEVSSNFIDIGIPEDYIKFCNWYAEGKKSDL